MAVTSEKQKDQSLKLVNVSCAVIIKVLLCSLAIQQRISSVKLDQFYLVKNLQHCMLLNSLLQHAWNWFFDANGAEFNMWWIEDSALLTVFSDESPPFGKESTGW